MRVKTIVIIFGLALWFSFCVLVIQGCAVSLVDGNRRMDFEVFMPYVTEEVTAEIEDDQVVLTEEEEEFLRKYFPSEKELVTEGWIK